jgi:HNH endonuclease/NUMOD4 motif
VNVVNRQLEVQPKTDGELFDMLHSLFGGDWAEVEGFSNYFVSSTGHVWSRPRTTTKGGLLALTPTAKGYMSVTLTREGKSRNVLVHHLVLLAFVGPRPVGLETRHLDGNAGNNRRENLAWGTSSENEYDEVNHGTHPQSSKVTCKNGHPFTHHDGKQRKCATCMKVSWSISNARRALEKKALAAKA